ncbi:MAG: NACHT domain-containing protein [Blautia sp.]
MGKEKFIPRLCGGTFFTLLLKARTNTRKSQNFLFKELMKLYDPSVSGVLLNSFKTPASQFKNCNQVYSCDYIKLGDTTTKRAFENRFRTDYEGILAETEKLCNDYLTKGQSSKSEIFIKDVLALISQDDSINDDEEFFIEYDGTAVRKKDFSELEALYFPSVVIGLWHYICTQRTDNSVGTKTIECWEIEPYAGDADMFAQVRILFNRPQFEDDEIESYITDEDEVVGDLSEVDLEKMAVVHHVGHEKMRRLRSPYDLYIEHAKDAFKKSKSFFYPNEERDFIEFYVCNDLTDKKSSYYGDYEFEYSNEPHYKDITVKKLADMSKFAVIVGTGGLGKSMMMRHLMLDALGGYEENRILPAFVILKDYDNKKQKLLDYIYSQIEHLNPDMSIADLTELMKTGNVIFLLDGLDEIKARCRNAFDDELNKLSEKYSKCQFVLSSRPIGSFGEFKHFKVFNLEPLSKPQAIKVIEKLDFRVYEENIKSDFIEELDKRLYAQKRDFAGNPLLLTIMLITFEQFHKIPTQKFLFYEQAYEALTQKHDATKALTREYATGLDPYDFKQYFSEFCIITYHAEQYKFSREQLEQYFQQVIELNHLSTTPAAFITDATDKICLLYVDGDSYYFCHRSFQEYFAAYFCSRQIEDRYDPIREMFNDKDDSAYDDETLQMLFGMDEQKTEKQIIIPFLESIFATGDDKTDYIEFLRRFYPVIEFDKGNVEEWTETQCTSWQFLFIAYHYNIKDEVCGDDIECDYDMAATIFVYMNKNWDKPDMPQEMELISLDSLPEGYKNKIDEYEYEDEENIEYAGMRVRIEVDFLYGGSKYTQLYSREKAILENETFACYQEFISAKRLLAELKEKYRKKKNTNWITMFH